MLSTPECKLEKPSMFSVFACLAPRGKPVMRPPVLDLCNGENKLQNLARG